MVKESNPVKLIKNPNSPEAIQARLNNQPDSTVPAKIHLITDNTAGRIFIDLTSTEVDQSVGYVITGGPRGLNRRYVRSIVSRDQSGRATITNYFTNIDKQQWIIIKSYLDQPLPFSDLPANYHGAAFPRGNYGGYAAGGIGVSARGLTWRNEGRNIAKLQAKQKKIHQGPRIDPDANRDIEQVEDRYFDDFTGEQ